VSAIPDADAQKQFHADVFNGRLDDCRRALQACPALARGFFNGETPLHVNAKSVLGSHHCVELLLEQGADPCALNNEGLTPFALAMKRGPTPQGATWAGMRNMVEHGADIWIKSRSDPMGLSSLHIATKKSANDAVFFLGTLGGPELIESLSAGGRRALHIAVEEGLTSTVKTLLDLGADPCALLDDGRCPVQLAMKRPLKAEQVVLLLIAHGGRAENSWIKYRGHSMPMAAAACGDIERLVALRQEAQAADQPWSEQDMIRARATAQEHQQENAMSLIDSWIASAAIDSVVRARLPKRIANAQGCGANP